MVVFKPSLVLFSVVLALGVAVIPAVHAAGFKLEIDTDDDQASKAKEPMKAPFACVIKSTSCKSTAHYLNQEYGPSLNLTTCHHDADWKNYWNRVTVGSGNGMFVNTFYVSTAADASVLRSAVEGGKCSVSKDTRPGALLTAAAVRDMLDDVINTHTRCNAYITCDRTDQVDDKCFPITAHDSKKDDDDDK
ncbi:hypothetical protein EX895_001028 [Sporisorium graminicola]|uniref:Ecp2 effector protein domain-containing protein n=1 Tax=Sporisorium graminicola TaxID=280036 RepID=A0A4V6EUN0_9BASI|nr:hypothetical protein EX895_001028 [Sporisorium graminicola]TKY91029.1 hypothetical protein EX895_001028 [Sporisorium graminicola]